MVTAISMQGVGRDFGATRALNSVDLDVEAGTIHALCGENGAGKSTCLGILAGRVAPTSGRVFVHGDELDYGQPRGAHQAGIAAIYQELTIVPHLSTQANVFLGQELTARGLRSDRRMRDEFVQMTTDLGLSLPTDVAAGSLSVADQQLLEIMRALTAKPRVVLFDEPSASLAPHERQVLFRVMRDLRRHGVTSLLVSHNLDEVLAISDGVTVFRNGVLVSSGPVAEWDKRRLIREMVGRDLATASAMLSDVEESAGEPLVRVRNLELPRVLGPLSFDIRPGEVLGVAGLVGSGRSTLLRSLAGATPGVTGGMAIDGVEVAWPTTPRKGRALGFALLPEDRKLAGLVLGMSAADNVVLSNFGTVSSRGLLGRRATRSAAIDAAAPVGFDRGRLDAFAQDLSGGNQQKLLVARWRHDRPRVLLADEPTRGVDIGAKGEILDSLRQLAAEGSAVVLVSSELEEIAQVADRAIVLVEGRQVGQLSRERGDLTTDAMLTMAFNTESEAS